MSEIQDEMMAAEAARQFLGISRTTMHRLLTSGELRGLKAGGQWRFRRGDLEAYLERKPHGVAASALPELDVEVQWWATTAGQPVSVDDASAEEKIGRLADSILAVAVAQEASDIHLEPHPQAALIRFRQDGVMSEVRSMSPALLPPLVRHFKELGAVIGEEAGMPQEGHVMLEIGGSGYSVRLATLPAMDGEALTIGLQRRPPNQALLFAMDELQFAPESLEQVKEWLGRPSGLILVVGPMGSGKHTTLHALASTLNTPDRKVMVFQEPAEILLPGAMHIKAGRQPDGLTTALRAALSQDPDVIVVGQAEDLPMLELLAHGSLGGHLVLSSLSTHTASRTIEKMVEMGLEPFVVGAMLTGIVAQRLVRRNCPNCVVDDEPNSALIATARQRAREGGYEVPEAVNWKRGAGCSRCRQSGLLGRTPIYEVVGNTDELTTAIMHGASSEELDQLARSQGSKSLFAEGVRHAVEGRISLDQLFRTIALPALA